MGKTLTLVILSLVLSGVTSLSAHPNQESDKKESAKTPIIEYGQTSELKYVKTFYVYSGLDIEARNNIVKEITKKVPGLSVTEKPEQADVVLIYGEESSRVFAGWFDSAHATATTYGNTTTATVNGSSVAVHKTIVDGDGLVVTRTKDNHARLLMKLNDTRKSKLERKPSTNFARAFVKAYEEANK